MNPARGTTTAVAASPYEGADVHTVAEVLDRLEEIQRYAEAQEPRGPDDGIACFNSLYATITNTVFEALQGSTFTDQPFITVLDVTFANRYFAALRAGALRVQIPEAWGILIEKRNDARINPIQFAAAGVNAHVNLDLAVAVADTCALLDSDPESGTKHEDYGAINKIFAMHMKELRERFEKNSVVRLLDHVAAPLFNMVDDLAVVDSRAVAWRHAVELWALRDRPAERAAFLSDLDRRAKTLGLLLMVSEP